MSKSSLARSLLVSELKVDSSPEVELVFDSELELELSELIELPNDTSISPESDSGWGDTAWRAGSPTHCRARQVQAARCLSRLERPLRYLSKSQSSLSRAHCLGVLRGMVVSLVKELGRQLQKSVFIYYLKLWFRISTMTRESSQNRRDIWGAQSRPQFCGNAAHKNRSGITIIIVAKIATLNPPNIMYYNIYLYHGNNNTYHCVITQPLQNGQTLGQFFELLYPLHIHEDPHGLWRWMWCQWIHTQGEHILHYRVLWRACSCWATLILPFISATNRVEPFETTNSILHLSFLGFRFWF